MSRLDFILFHMAENQCFQALCFRNAVPTVSCHPPPFPAPFYPSPSTALVHLRIPPRLTLDSFVLPTRRRFASFPCIHRRPRATPPETVPYPTPACPARIEEGRIFSRGGHGTSIDAHLRRVVVASSLRRGTWRLLERIRIVQKRGGSPWKAQVRSWRRSVEEATVSKLQVSGTKVGTWPSLHVREVATLQTAHASPWKATNVRWEQLQDAGIPRKQRRSLLGWIPRVGCVAVHLDVALLLREASHVQISTP